jgi:hypothetical protein
MYPSQLSEVAVLVGGVGALYGLMVVVESQRGFAHVVVGASKQIVSQHPVVGGSVAVEVVHEDALEAVAAEDGVGLVGTLQRVELCTALGIMKGTTGEEEWEKEH